MDVIYPIHSFDGTSVLAKFGVLCALEFAEALDSARLEAALNKLLTSDEDWLKWTGRLRRNKDNTLELHIPREFTAARRPARFSVADYPYSLAEHSVAKLLPRQTEKISVYEDPEKYRFLYQDQATPQRFKAYLDIERDEPVLAVHVTRFSDATFIGVSFPHVMADAPGISLLLNAWADVLADKPIPKLISYKEDRMAQVSFDSKDRNAVGIVESFALSWWREMVFIFWMIVSILLQYNVETVNIYVPAKVIRKWREDAIEEMSGEWLSESDVITAWLIQHRMSNLKRDVSAWIVVDVRKRLPQVPANYSGNATMPLVVPILNRDTMSIAQAAHQIRKSIIAQSTPEELVKEINFTQRSRKARGRDSVIAVPGSDFYIVTNWIRAGLFSIDFKGALPGPRQEPVFPISGSPMGFAELPVRNVMVIGGKDVQSGGYLLHCQVPRAQLEKFKAAILASGEM